MHTSIMKFGLFNEDEVLLLSRWLQMEGARLKPLALAIQMQSFKFLTFGL